MAGIIKSGQWRGRRTGGQPAEFNFDDMARRAEGYLQTVREQAETIVAEARQRAVQLEEQALEKARQTARAEAEQRLGERLHKELDKLLPIVKKTADEIGLAKHGWLNQWQRETVHLAVAIAERIIRRELGARPEITQDLVREVLELAAGSGQFKLHLNPDDVEAFGPWVEKLAAEMGELAPTDVVADEEISRGGCRVVTQFGAIDHSIEAQLARIEEELT